MKVGKDEKEARKDGRAGFKEEGRKEGIQGKDSRKVGRKEFNKEGR